MLGDMDFSELRPRINSKGIAQVGWSGVALLEAELPSPTVTKIAAVLRCPPRDFDLFGRKLAIIARRFRQSLRQCEFGPTRPDQKAMLSWQLSHLNSVKELLSNLSPEQAYELSNEIFSHLTGKPCIDFEALVEAICDAELSVQAHDKVFFELQEHCIWLVQCTDTNTASDLFLEEVSDPNECFTLPSSDRFSLDVVLAWLDRMCARREARSKIREYGPEPSVSLWLAVYWLAWLYKEETGQNVTHYNRDDCVGSQSAAGRFVLNAVTELLPPVDAFPAEVLTTLPVGARIFADCRNQLPGRVRNLMKLYVREIERPASRGRKRGK
jgi:hypothetical protein